MELPSRHFDNFEIDQNHFEETPLSAAKIGELGGLVRVMNCEALLTKTEADMLPQVQTELNGGNAPGPVSFWWSAPIPARQIEQITVPLFIFVHLEHAIFDSTCTNSARAEGKEDSSSSELTLRATTADASQCTRRFSQRYLTDEKDSGVHLAGRIDWEN